MKFLIIGGGPAGLITALKLRKYYEDITVVDKSVWPIDKVCGEGIMPTGVKYLNDLSIFENISQDEMHSFTGIKYINEKGKVALGKFKHLENGIGIKRSVLSKTLFKLCEERGVKLLSKFRYIDFVANDNGGEANIENLVTKEIEQISFDYLIAADGRLSKVREQLDFEDSAPTQMKRIGATVHYKIEPWSKFVEVWWAKGIEAYVTPVGKELITVTFTWDSQKIKPERNMLLEYFPALKDKIAEVEQVGELGVLANLAHQAVSPINGRVIFVGDACIFIDGITGEGVSLLSEQAHYLVQAFQNNDLKGYEEKVQSIAKKYIFLTGKVLLISKYPLIRNLFIQLLSLWPKLFDHLIEVNMGRRALYQFWKM